MNPRHKPPEILKKGHAHKSVKDYDRLNGPTIWLIEETCPVCGLAMVTDGTEEWCVNKGCGGL